MYLRELLKLATDGASENWQRFIHEKDCRGGPESDDPNDCKCDGNLIVMLVKKALRYPGKQGVGTPREICPACNGDGIHRPHTQLRSGATKRCTNCSGRGTVYVQPVSVKKLKMPSGTCKNYGGTWSCFDPRRSRPVRQPCEPCLKAQKQ